MSLSQEIELARVSLPEIAASVTQLVVDNPGQFALMGAGAIVLTRTALNVVRPRSPLEAVALLAVLELAVPFMVRKVINAGVLKFRVRNEAGELVPLALGDA